MKIPITGNNNVVREFNGFHIAYDHGTDTTALVLRNHVFFVLAGDHVHDWDKAAKDKGIQGCIDLFVERMDQAHRRSEHRMAVGLDSDIFNLRPTLYEMIGKDGIEKIIDKVKSHAN